MCEHNVQSCRSLGHLRPCVERGTQILRTEREVVFCDYRPYALAVMVYPSPTSLEAQGAKKQACLRDYLILGDGSGTMVGTWQEAEKHQFHAPVGACLCEDFAGRCTSCKHESRQQVDSRCLAPDRWPQIEQHCRHQPWHLPLPEAFWSYWR